MKTQFDIFKQTLLSNTLDCLWNQWSTLGVAGASDTKDLGIVDPEALILLSVFFAEKDLRLFDEMLSWLISNGDLINTKRLEKLHDQHDFKSRRLLAGIAEYVVKKHTNWRRLLASDFNEESEIYWLSSKADNAKRDLNFEKNGVYRSIFKNRKLSFGFCFNHPNSLLPRLRSLLGMNAHCEILSYYADGRRVHASKAARDLAYSQKAIQEILMSMEKVAGVSSYQDGKNKLYSLNKPLWKSMIPPDVTWINPIEKYALTKDIWRLTEKVNIESEDIQLTSTLIKHEYLRWKKKHPAYYDTSLEHEQGRDFIQKWKSWSVLNIKSVL